MECNHCWQVKEDVQDYVTDVFNMTVKQLCEDCIDRHEHGPSMEELGCNDY